MKLGLYAATLAAAVKASDITIEITVSGDLGEYESTLQDRIETLACYAFSPADELQDCLNGESSTTPQILVSTETPDVTTEAPIETTEAPVETTVAPVVTTEAPVETTEAPVETTEAPVETTEAPVETTEAPVETTEAPVETTEAPVETTEAPVETTEAPVETTEAPLETTEAPIETTEAPLETTEPPLETTEAPIETTEAPVTTTEPPVETTEAPIVTTEPSVETTESPIITTEEPPVATTEEPIVTTEEPVVTTTEEPVVTTTEETVVTTEAETTKAPTEAPTTEAREVTTAAETTIETTTASADDRAETTAAPTTAAQTTAAPTTAAPTTVAATTEAPTTAIVFGDCECTSTDKDNLSAEQCDQHGNCIDCTDTSSCGTQADWTEWSDCSVTCGGGTRTRRECFTWADGTDDCDDESEDCNEDDCPAWAAWKPWGSCSAQCKESDGDDPTRTRYRCWDPEDGSGEQCAGGEQNSGSGEQCGRDASDVCYQEQTESCNEDIECTVECEWTEWGEWGSCTPACKDGLRIRRRENNEDDGASCDGAGAQSERCTTVETEECPECLNYYEKCDKIPTSFCSDIRYSAQLERLCNKHCGYCSKRRKRSIFDRFPRQSDFTVLEFLADSYHDL